jgi:hypothetical protein
MSLYSDNEIPRHEPENPENLTKMELTERELAISAIMAQIPNASPKIVEMCWNYIRRNTVETVREQINTGFFDKPSEFANPPGGTLKTAWVYNADGTLAEPEPELICS